MLHIMRSSILSQNCSHIYFEWLILIITITITTAQCNNTNINTKLKAVLLPYLIKAYKLQPIRRHFLTFHFKYSDEKYITRKNHN